MRFISFRKIFNKFNDVLDKVKIIDNLTFGAPKIMYLVGWQYRGHDETDICSKG